MRKKRNPHKRLTGAIILKLLRTADRKEPDESTALRIVANSLTEHLNALIWSERNRGKR